MDVNLTGTLRTCQSFYAALVKSGHGRVVNIASLSSFVSLFEVAAYCASKAAVLSLTKSLAIEWAKDGVCVNAIAPGRVSDGVERVAVEWHGARAGVHHAYADGALWQDRGVGGGGGFAGV